MKTLKTILKWFFGITFLLGGLAGLFDTPLVGLISIMIGLFILPPSFKLIEQKTKYSFPTPIKWIVTIAGMVLMGVVVSKSNDRKDEQVHKIVARASQAIDYGNLDSAFILIEEAKGKYSTAKNNKAVDLEKEIEKSKSEDYAKEVLAKMTNEEFAKLQNNEWIKSYINQQTLNKNFYQLLNELSPQRQQIVEEIKAKEEQERIAAELEAESKRKAEQQRNRKELVEKQFSSWDGSHLGLSRLIKDNMNDPDSYEHVETKFRDDGAYIFVIAKFRGNNAFGGKVVNTVSAKVDFEGNVIEIVSQN